MSAEAQKVTVEVEGRTLTLSNLGKVLYPLTGFTKAQVIDYYLRIAPVLLPHIAGRPLTLKRYPDGVTGPYFYEKNAPRHRPGWVPTARIVSPGSTKHREIVEYVVAGDLPTLIWVANLADLEIHTPMWRLPGIGEPDLLVFDLDPGPPATVVECCRVARWLRDLVGQLARAKDVGQLGPDPLAKTSGGKGLQVYAALAGLTSVQASELARRVAAQLEQDHPELVVSRMARGLRTGKVFIDWSQNNAAKTTVAPYSLRAMPRPTVSTPVTWAEVSACGSPDDLLFTSDEVLDRVDRLGDLLAPLIPSAGRA
jgi:bifunctional non-homologous end joining protein LigD